MSCIFEYTEREDCSRLWYVQLASDKFYENRQTRLTQLGVVGFGGGGVVGGGLRPNYRAIRVVVSPRFGISHTSEVSGHVPSINVERPPFFSGPFHRWFGAATCDVDGWSCPRDRWPCGTISAPGKRTGKIISRNVRFGITYRPSGCVDRRPTKTPMDGMTIIIAGLP